MAYEVKDLQELLTKTYPIVKNFLGEIEQVSYTMIMIDKNKLTYSSGGMYPFMIKKSNEIIKIKANNTPFMNFLDIPKVEEIDISGYEAIILYSDGIVEHENKELAIYSPQEMIKNPTLIKEMQQELKEHKLDDDATLVYITR